MSEDPTGKSHPGEPQAELVDESAAIHSYLKPTYLRSIRVWITFCNRLKETSFRASAPADHRRHIKFLPQRFTGSETSSRDWHHPLFARKVRTCLQHTVRNSLKTSTSCGIAIIYLNVGLLVLQFLSLKVTFLGIQVYLFCMPAASSHRHSFAKKLVRVICRIPE